MLLTQSKASKLPYAPSRPGLCKKAKEIPLPGYFVQTGKHLMVETESPEWIGMLERRGANPPPMMGKNTRTGGKSPGKVNPSSKPVDKKRAKDQKKIMAESALQIKKANDLKNEGLRYANDIKKLAAMQKAGDVIDFDLASWLFFGYMEKLGVDILNLCKKIEPMVDNLVKEKDTAGVLALFHKHHKQIIATVKKSQAKELKDWKKNK